jgi:hypothetical protein
MATTFIGRSARRPRTGGGKTIDGVGTRSDMDIISSFLAPLKAGEYDTTIGEIDVERTRKSGGDTY